MAANDEHYVEPDAICHRQAALIDLIENDAAQYDTLLRHARIKLKIFSQPDNLDIDQSRIINELVRTSAYYVAKNQMYAETPCPEVGDKQALKEIMKVMDMIIDIETKAASNNKGGRSC